VPTGNFTAGDVFYATDDNSVGKTPSTAYGRARMNDADATAARTALGLGTAATHATGDYDVAGAAAAAQAASQPLNPANLSAIAALATTAFGRDFLIVADALAGRTKLGLGTAATQSQAAFQADSVAADVASLVADFNSLLAKLRASGLMAAA
jgi:hypothetical protein